MKATRHSVRPFVTFIGLFLVNAVALTDAREVGPLALSVADLERELAFYTNTLAFRLIGEEHASGVEVEKLTGLPGAHTRTAELQLGDPDGHLLEIHP